MHTKKNPPARCFLCIAALFFLSFFASCTTETREAAGPSIEPVAAEKAAQLSDDPEFNKLCLFLDDCLKDHDEDYRDAVKLISFELAKFCTESDEPEKNLKRAGPSYSKSAKTTGGLSFHNPKNSSGHSTYVSGIQWENGSVVSLDFELIHEIDSCPCTSDEFPEFLDDEFLDVIIKIDTLEHLNLPNAKITDAGLKKLACLTELKTLNISGRCNYHVPLQNQLDFSGFQALHGLVKLETLIVRQGENSVDKVDSEALFEALTHYPNLREFQAEYVKLNRQNVERLATCEQLEVLSLEKAEMTEPCLDVIDALEKLQSLTLKLTPNGHEIVFTQLPNLDDLRIVLNGNPEAPQREKQDVRIIGLEKVSSLSVTTQDILEPRIELADMPNLNYPYISLNADNQTEELIPSVSLQNLPKVTFFTCDGPFSKGTLSLRGTENIKDFLLRYSAAENVGWGDDREPQMRDAASTTPISKIVFDEILKLENLESLKLYGPFDGVDLTQLNRLPKLNRLTLSGRLSDDPEFRLTGLENIQRIELQNVAGTEKIIFEKLPALENLETSSAYMDEIFVLDCPQLADFYFGSARIRNLVFEQCPALTKFRIDVSHRSKIELVDLRETQVQKIEWMGNYQPHLISDTKILMPE